MISSIIPENPLENNQDNNNNNEQQQQPASSPSKAIIVTTATTQIVVQQQQQQQLKPIQTAAANILFYGSCEADQFKTGKEDVFIARRPCNYTNYFTEVNRIVHAVACGGMHTIILTTNGEVYTLGCNDDGALGREAKEGSEKVPGLVKLNHKIDMISAGDSHTVACNSTNSVVYYWGLYRNTTKGKISESKEPHIIGKDEFKRKKIRKIISGQNHTMILADERVYAWGDAETCVLGRMPASRRKLEQGLRIEAIGTRDIEDVWTGQNHSFLKRMKGDVASYFAWGLNNYGQLGTGDLQTSFIPTEIVEFRGKNIKNITGGEHHTIAVDDKGDVYAWGKNDDGQLGLGENYVQPESETNGASKEDEVAAAADNNTMEVEKEPVDTNAPLSQDIAAGKSQDQAGTVRADQDPFLMEQMRAKLDKLFKKVTKPTLVALTDIKKIYSGQNYNYAINNSNEVYSWGDATDYVLGTREEDTEYVPVQISEAFFSNNQAVVIGCGSQHVAAITVPPGTDLPLLDPEVTALVEEPAGGKAAGKSSVKKKPHADTSKGKKDEEDAFDHKDAVVKKLDLEEIKEEPHGKRKSSVKPVKAKTEVPTTPKVPSTPKIGKGEETKSAVDSKKKPTPSTITKAVNDVSASNGKSHHTASKKEETIKTPIKSSYGLRNKESMEKESSGKAHQADSGEVKSSGRTSTRKRKATFEPESGKSSKKVKKSK
jgi:regulator of chromosome condensation